MSTASPSASGSSARNAFSSSQASSHAAASSVRAQKPTLALPPLSPDRAPIRVPSGIRRVSPLRSLPAALPPAAGGAAVVAEEGGGGAGGVWGMTSRRPSAWTTTCSTSSAGTSAGQQTPYGPGSPRGGVRVNTGDGAAAA